MRAEKKKSVEEKSLLLLQRFLAVTRIRLISLDHLDIFAAQMNREEKKPKLLVSSLRTKSLWFDSTIESHSYRTGVCIPEKPICILFEIRQSLYAFRLKLDQVEAFEFACKWHNQA